MYVPQSFVYVDAYPIITVNGIDTYRKLTIKCEFNAANHTHEGEARDCFVDLSRSDVKRLYDEYSELIVKKQEYTNAL
jgi:hypothetical protein